MSDIHKEINLIREQQQHNFSAMMQGLASLKENNESQLAAMGNQLAAMASELKAFRQATQEGFDIVIGAFQGYRNQSDALYDKLEGAVIGLETRVKAVEQKAHTHQKT